MAAPPSILVAYHTEEGQTAHVAARIGETLERLGAEVAVLEADSAPAPAGYDGVVVGDSIHAGHHSKALTRYLRSHAADLRARPAALFQVSLTSKEDDESSRDKARSYVDDLLEATDFDPDLVAMFAGALAYTKYGWLKRTMMSRISRMAGDPSDTTRDFEFTDWDAVEQFASDVYGAVATVP